MTILGAEKITSLVGECFLFKGLDHAAKALLVESAVPREYEDQDVLLREDEDGTEMMIVDSGEIEVSQLTGGGDVTLANLGPGAVLGEVAVIAQIRRTSTVKAIGPVVAVSFSADIIRQISAANPKVASLFMRLIEGRARQTISIIPG